MTANFKTLPMADRYAILKAEIETLTKELDAVKSEIKATGREIVEGNSTIVTIALSERTSLDPKMAKMYLTPEQVLASSKTILVETLRIKPRFLLAAE